MLRCTAILMVRNGAPYIKRCLEYLLEQDIQVAVLDHGSTDGTYERCVSYKKHGVCFLERVAYDGSFALLQQLELKQALLSQLDTDWIIHQDVDEILQPSVGGNLLEWIRRAEEKNYNAINFDEMVFLPYESEDFYQSTHYYYFSPFFPRLMRVWKKNACLSALNSGGHVLMGDVKLSPDNGVLRHYIFTNQEHALEKYKQRIFLEDELDKGWHGNRVNIALESLKFPDKTKLSCLPHGTSSGFDYSNAFTKHYWQWGT